MLSVGDCACLSHAHILNVFLEKLSKTTVPAKNLRVVGIGSARILGLFLHCITLQEKKTFEYSTCTMKLETLHLSLSFFLVFKST